MKTYIGVKVVNATPMNRQAYNEFRGWQVPENENPQDEGYLVEYQDSAVQPELAGKANGYVSWSPKEVFEQSYSTTAEGGRVFYAKSDNGSIYIGDGATLDEAKQSAEQTEKSASLDNSFDFGTALYLLKAGQKVARAGWNEQGMFLLLISGEAVTEAINNRYGNPTLHDVASSEYEKCTIIPPVLDAVYMKTDDNKLVPWFASQTDLLSDDWELVD